MSDRQATILPGAEMELRRRVEDALSWLLAVDQRQRATSETLARLEADNRRLRRALRTLAKLQPERVRRAVMEVMHDA